MTTLPTEAALEVKLLPCPFCGHAAALGHIRYSRPLNDTTWADETPITEAHYVNCVWCGAVCRSGIVGGYQTQAEAIAAWNTRLASPINSAWQPMETAPKGLPTESVGCRDVSEWFLAKDKRGRIHEIHRRAWPQDDGWADRDETYYVPDYFTHWAPKPATPPEQDRSTSNGDGA